MILKKYIKEVLMINERNQPGLLKKSFDYDLLIADLTPKKMAAIYKNFQDDSLIDNFITAKTGSPDVRYDSSNSVEANIDALEESRFSLIKLKKNETVIKYLRDYFKFNFSNCNLSDNAPILCMPADSLGGENGAIIYTMKRDKKKEDLLKNQAIKELEDWNWAAHDFHHGETMIRTDGGENRDESRIMGKKGPYYFSSQKTGYEYMDRHASNSPGKSGIIDDYWLTLIGFYFNKIGFTRGVGYLDIWVSVYSYCLTKMSGPEDAYNMDFTIVNEPGKKNLILGKGEIKALQDFFASSYETVQKYSGLNKYKDGIIYIAHMFA